MTGQDRIDDLRDDSVVVTNDSGKHRRIAIFANPGDQILTQFILHTAGGKSFFRKRAAAQFAKRPRQTHRAKLQGND